MSLATLKTLFNIGGNGAGLPVEVGFARNTVYWKTLLVVFVNSIFISFMGLLYMNCINAVRSTKFDFTSFIFSPKRAMKRMTLAHFLWIFAL